MKVIDFIYKKITIVKEVFWVFIFTLVISQLGLSQNDAENTTDSLILQGRFALLGRWQTGNLNQISLMPNGNISLQKRAYFTEVNVTYHYLKVNDFNVKNDLWFNGLYQHHPSGRLYPSLHTIIGYATSYRIDHSMVFGLGAGYNIHNKSPSNFLQVHLYAAYFNFQYEQEPLHESLALGSRVRATIPVSNFIHIQWELASYHSTKDHSFWGGSNFLQLNFKILKNLMFNISHQTYHSNQSAINIKNTNTEMLFGIQFQFNNH